jgi:hypothetical protein
MIKMYIGLRVKCLLLLSDFNETRIFLTHNQKNAQISNYMKIHPVGAELFHAERERLTDMTQLTVASHNFENVPKN